MRTLKHLKEYKVFEQEEFDFDKLANIGLFKNVVINLVKVFESTIYKNLLITKNSKFLEELSKLVKDTVDKKTVKEQDYFRLFSRWEETIYKSSKIHQYESSIRSLLEESILSLMEFLNGRLETEEYEQICQEMFKKKASEIIINNDDYKHEDPDMKLVTAEDDEYAELRVLLDSDIEPKPLVIELTKIFEKKFRKRLDLFTYSDKLKARDWFLAMPEIKDLSKEELKNILKVFDDFIGF